MNTEFKTDKNKLYCAGCEEYTDKYVDDCSGVDGLCEYCDYSYDNKTGYCSLDCCLGYGCDESC